MTYTTPATPVSGTAITVAFYGTNIKDNIIHLRALLPDAGASNQVLNSSSSTVAAWTSNPTIAGNLTINGTLAVTGTTVHTGGVTISGGNLSMGSGRTVTFSTESAEKIVMDSSSSSIGTFTNGVYLRAPVLAEFRDSGGTQRIQMTLAASPSMTIGGNTVATLNSANFTALQMGGITVARPATSTYTGDGGTSGRQITVGFVPKLVHLWSQTSGSTMYIIMHDGGSIRLHNGGNPEYTTEVKLHASDGFIVGAGAQHRGNDVAETYRWVAMI
jgi:hypothetical protein